MYFIWSVKIKWIKRLKKDIWIDDMYFKYVKGNWLESDMFCICVLKDI